MAIIGAKAWRRVAMVAGCGCLAAALAGGARAQEVPKYKVDASWPKQLPDNWIMEGVTGLSVDQQDHIWVLQRPGDITKDEAGAAANPPRAMCCRPAPSVLEFDTDGNVIRSWGGPGYVPDWPAHEHTLFVDKEENVWIGGAGSLLKFSSDGKLLLEIAHGRAGKGKPDNQSHDLIDVPASVDVDESAHEVYVADGNVNKRVMVYDSDTGAFKRGWGAYGIPLNQIDNDPPVPPAAGVAAKQFTPTVHCVHISEDGLVYVCDRGANRIQVFTKQGKFVKEFFVHPSTPASGPNCGRGFPCSALWSLSFSHDPMQKYLLIGDGTDNVIWILNRNDGSEAGMFGHSGRNAGQFHWLECTAMDSHGNLYTGEVGDGKRVQKFTLVNP